MEKSISRAELLEDAGSLASSPESIALDQLEAFEEIEYIQPLDVERDVDQTDGAEKADEEITFRLFAQSTRSVDAVQTIKLKSPTAEAKEGGFTQPRRDPSYYFTSPANNYTYEQAAIAGSDIQRLASIKWTGVAYPWKVLDLPASQITRAARQGLQAWASFTGADEAHRRRRPGKKARIKLRIKVAAAKNKAAETKAASDAKDAALREKKTRLNREKKAKKRQRDKLKRAAERQGDEGVDDHADNGDESDALSG